MRNFDTLDGALLVDKPAGPTSHDVVEAVRRRFQIKKVGHCGTLDPNATGLLVLLLGRATKLSDKLMSSDKIYEGTLKLGETTTTYDADGELVSSLPVPDTTLDQLNELSTTFVGDLLQVPPMVSAIKKNGVPLYKLARKGIVVEREPRLVHVYVYRFSEYLPPIGKFRVACTKGTYVRALVHDLGAKLGCGAFLQTLRREASGNFQAADALSLGKVLELSPDQLQARVIPFFRLVDMG